MERFTCVRCARDGVSAMGGPPFPNELGTRIAAEICTVCWEEWKKHQMLLINHYGLNLRDPAAKEFLYANIRSFLFSEGEASPIDTSQEGTI
ncbi:MAG: oxidative damage protection protein [Gemmatimonadota bacterium]